MLAPKIMFHSVLFLFLLLGLIMAGKPAFADEPVKSPESKTIGGDLSFMDDQQTWKKSEFDNYTEWLKRNPRYSHPMFKSKWNDENGTNFVDDKPDPNYRGWTQSPFWFGRGPVSHVRGRILWVNDRYPSGKYYSSTKNNESEKSK